MSRWQLFQCGADGTVVVAGQSHDSASAYSADVLAWRAGVEGVKPPPPEAPAWLARP